MRPPRFKVTASSGSVWDDEIDQDSKNEFEFKKWRDSFKINPYVTNYNIVNKTVDQLRAEFPEYKLEVTVDGMKIHVQLRDPSTNELAKPPKFFIIPSEEARRSPKFQKDIVSPKDTMPQIPVVPASEKGKPVEAAKTVNSVDNKNKSKNDSDPITKSTPEVKVKVNLNLDFRFKNLSSELVEGEAARLGAYLKTVYAQINANRPEGFTDDQIYLVIFGDTPRQSDDDLEMMNGHKAKADGSAYTGKDLMEARAKVLADLIKQAASIGTMIPPSNIFHVAGVGGPGGQLRGHGIMATRDLILADHPDIAARIGLKKGK